MRTKTISSLGAVIVSVMVSLVSHANTIYCDHGFAFYIGNGFASMNYDSNTVVFDQYLARDRRGFYVDGLRWNSFHNSYFSSGPGGPTVNLYIFDAGATMRLVANRSGNLQEFWFHGCSND